MQISVINIMFPQHIYRHIKKIFYTASLKQNESFLNEWISFYLMQILSIFNKYDIFLIRKGIL